MKIRNFQEIEDQIAESQQSLSRRIDALNEKVRLLAARYSKEAIETNLFGKFIANDKINYYTWTQEYSFALNRHCFTSSGLITPGTKAYKGTLMPAKGDSATHHLLPKEIWLTREEFTMRRLKGQI